MASIRFLQKLAKEKREQQQTARESLRERKFDPKDYYRYVFFVFCFFFANNF